MLRSGADLAAPRPALLLPLYLDAYLFNIQFFSIFLTAYGQFMTLAFKFRCKRLISKGAGAPSAVIVNPSYIHLLVTFDWRGKKSLKKRLDSGKGRKIMELWTDYALQIAVVGPMLALALLYVLRRQAHAMLLRLAKSLHRLLRLAARGCLRAEQRIRLRNHEVTKALAEALMERQLERRFMRIERLVERDLDNYQKLSMQINQQLTSIHEDYESSSLVPDPSPEWIAAVEAIASLEGDQRNSEVMARILGDIHGTVKEHQREALREHRWTVSARHKVLAGLRPQWRKLAKLLEHVDHNIEILRQRLRQVDKHMGQFELLTAGSGQGIMSSMFMRFVIALSFVLLGTAAAWVNIQLLAQPLSRILEQQTMGDLVLAPAMGVLHVGTTLVAAALITESLKVTHLLPLAGAMGRKGRSALMWIGASLLGLNIILEAVALIGISAEGTLAFAGVSSALLAMMAVATTLVVAVCIIPLEYLLHTVRPVVGALVQVMLHVLALATRLLASLAVDIGRASVIVYDAVIFLPLMLERTVIAKRLQLAAATEQPDQAPVMEPAAPRNVTALRFRDTRSGQE